MAAQTFILTVDVSGGAVQPRTTIRVEDPEGTQTCKGIAEAIKTAEGTGVGMWLVPTKATGVDGSAIGDVVYVKNVVMIAGPA